MNIDSNYLNDIARVTMSWFVENTENTLDMSREDIKR